MKFYSLLAASIFALAISPAAALDLSVGGGASAGASVSGISTDLSASASADLSVGTSHSGSSSVEADGTVSATGIGTAKKVRLSKNLAVVIDLIETADYSEATFAAVADVRGKIYDVGARANAQGRAALDAVIAANRSEIAELQAALSASAELNGWLSARGTDISSVVAVGATANGSLAVFTR